MLSVGINGYGTIGKRVADAVRTQPDMTVAGVVKTSPDHVAALADDRGFSLYVPTKDYRGEFRAAGMDPAGTLEDLLDASDIVVDATPGGVGQSYVPKYREAGIPYILQGAEPAKAAAASFCAGANGPSCVDEGSLRVVSCNTTGLARTLATLGEVAPVDRVDVTLVRRGGDPTQTDRGPINDILPTTDVPSHHAEDLRTVLPDVSIHTVAMTVPTTLMHVHGVTVTFESTPDERAIREQLAGADRLALVPGDRDLDAISALIEVGRDMGRPRGDIWETCLWEDSIDVRDRRLSFIQAVHQESIVVPETIDAIRTLAGEDPIESAEWTNEHLGVGQLRFGSRERTTPVTAE